MRILIADDSSDKIGAINNALREIPEYEMFSIDKVLDLSEAKEALYENFYDLLILDLNMPIRIGEKADMQTGIDFVNEVMSTNRIKKPIDIIVLSAFDESVEAFKKSVENEGFVTIQYSQTVETWKNVLISRINYLNLLCEQRRFVPMPPKCDVLLITAVDVEAEAIRGWSKHWRKFKPEDDSTVYEYIESGIDGFQHNLVHVQLPEMGMTAAAVFVTKSITHFCPQYVIMTGIAAGLEKDADVGDVMVATDVLNYSGGKYVETDGNVKLLPDSKNRSMDRALTDKITSLDYQEVMKQIKNNFEGDSPNHKPKVHFGQIACGTAVVASDAVVTEQIKAHSRKAIGLDMESYSVYFAAQFVKDPGIKAIVVKSISDFANSKKGDGYQKYAAYTSAEFAKHLICHVLEFE